jgi:hypothetical protein
MVTLECSHLSQTGTLILGADRTLGVRARSVTRHPDETRHSSRYLTVPEPGEPARQRRWTAARDEMI